VLRTYYVAYYAWTPYLGVYGNMDTVQMCEILWCTCSIECVDVWTCAYTHRLASPLYTPVTWCWLLSRVLLCMNPWSRCICEYVLGVDMWDTMMYLYYTHTILVYMRMYTPVSVSPLHSRRRRRLRRKGVLSTPWWGTSPKTPSSPTIHEPLI